MHGYPTRTIGCTGIEGRLFTEGEAMKRLCAFIARTIEAIILVAVYVITLPVRLMDKIIYSK